MSAPDLRAALAKAGFKGLHDHTFHILNKAEKALQGARKVVPYYTEIRLQCSIEDVVSAYTQWALGTGLYAHKRGQREQDLGQDASLTADSLSRGYSTPRANRGYHVLDTRWDEFGTQGTRWLLRLEHWNISDILALVQKDPEADIIEFVRWGNYVEVTENGDAILLRHAIQISHDPIRRWNHFPGVPVVVRDLLRSNLVLDPPPSRKVIRLDQSTYEDYLVHELLEPNRSLPILVASPRRDEHGQPHYPFDLEEMADHLFGIAQVVSIEDDARGADFTAAITKHGGPVELGCYGGAAHLYTPDFRLQDAKKEDHPFWSHGFFERYPAKTGRNIMAFQIGALVTSLRMPTGFLSRIDQIDQEQRFNTQHERDTVKQLLKSYEEQKAHVDLLYEEFQRQEKLNADLQRDLETTRLKLEEAEYRLQKALGRKALHQESSDAAEEDVHLAVLAGNPTLEQALRYLQLAFPRRVTVLASALDSAQESEEFKYRDRAFDLMKKLCIDYWDALTSGKGDAQARQIFGADAFASTESETVTGNTRAMRLRTFIYEDREVQMLAHLKIGTKDSVADTWRCHFMWDAKAKRIVIGHCGKHLDHR